MKATTFEATNQMELVLVVPTVHLTEAGYQAGLIAFSPGGNRGRFTSQDVHVDREQALRQARTAATRLRMYLSQQATDVLAGAPDNLFD